MEKNLKPSAYQQKSFYGKAKVRTENGETILRSYKTDVCKIDSSGNFVKLWNGYSRTTMNHIVAFCDEYGIECNGKKWWTSLPYYGEKTEQYVVEMTNGFWSKKCEVVFDNEDDAEAFADTVKKNSRSVYAYVSCV